MHWSLTPLSFIYGAAVRARNCYYDRVASAVQRAAVPVISVGNLTVGGTGKTPLVIEVVRRLRTWGRRPAILTRGYRGTPAEPADEVLEFHTTLPEVPVVVNADRAGGAATACRQHQADCLVLDDGFQHRRLARDLDIVLVDALAPWPDRLLPAGRRREPWSSLRRADLIVITRSNQVAADRLRGLTTWLRHWSGPTPLACAALQADALVARDGQRRPATELAARRILAVCGIGQPQTFVRLLKELTCQPFSTRVFADHQRYDRADIQVICDAAGREGAELVVTTRKDWVKLHALWPDAAPPLVRLDVRVLLTTGGAEFEARLRQALEGNR